MVRILHIISSANPANGGPIEGIRQRGMELVKLGHQVEVATCDDPGAPWLKDLDFATHALGPGKGGYQFTPHLVPWLLENGPRFDAVIANGIWQFSSYATRKAMLKLGKPYFVFTHGMLDPWFKKTYPLKHIKKALYWPGGEYRVLRDAAAVLFTSEEEMLLARESFRPYQVNERVVRYGTSRPSGNRQSQVEQFLHTFTALQHNPYLLFLSRIHPKKGVDLLIRAFADVYKDQPHQLVIAGPDQVGWAEDLKRMADELNIQDRIVWTGMLSGDLKWGAYHGCEAFVLPSHQENFGIVVAEALACGKPVLISNKVNIWREIESAGAGFVAEDTEEGTLTMLQTWLDMSSRNREEMGCDAQKCFEDNFEIAASADSLLSVIKEICRSNRS